VNKDELALLHSNQRHFVEELQKKGIEVNIVNKDMELLCAKLGNHVEWILDRDSSVMPYSVSIVCGNKFLTKKILENGGISVPKGELFSPNQKTSAILFAEKLGYPVVIKPVFGSHGDNVFMNIDNMEDAYEILNNHFFDEKFIVEKEFLGKEFRVFLTKDGSYAVLHRDPAHVFGDGKSTIKELIENENEKRLERKNALCPIVIDEIAKKYFSKKHLSLVDIPRKDEKIYLRPSSNVAKGGVCEDYTDLIHPSVIKNCKNVLDIFGTVPYLGIDYMSSDITAVQTSDKYSIVEVNTVPGIHMHMNPAIGKSRNVAKMLVDVVFPETKEKRNQNEQGFTPIL